MIKYDAGDFFMVRTPLLSIEDYFALFEDSSRLNVSLKSFFDTTVAKEALVVASKDLYEAYLKNDLNVETKASEKLRLALTKYSIRMSTRPTPFGLFSGVSIGQFGDRTNISISNSKHHTKRARADMEWVYGLIKKIEANKQIVSQLSVRFNDLAYVSGNRINKSYKTFLDQDESDTSQKSNLTSIRYTDQVKKVEEMCKEYYLFSKLFDDVCASNLQVPVQKIEAFLYQLFENEFLISELRPPLINADVLGHLIGVLDKIAGVDEAAFCAAKLREVQQNISKYNLTSVGEGIDLFNETMELQKDLYTCKNYLQVDTKTHLDNNSLSRSLKDELEEFVSAMCRLAIPNKISDEMAAYTQLFLETYGGNPEVPVLELLDIDDGIGLPEHYQMNGLTSRPIPKRQKSAKEIRLATLLNRKLMMTLKAGGNRVELTNNDIEYVHGDEESASVVKPMDFLQSFELYLLTHPGVLNNKEENDFYFTVAPAVSSKGFGRTFGRFNDLLASEELLSLKEGFENEKDLLSEYIIAEIAELPQSGRLSNLSINSSDYDYQISLATSPAEGKHVLSIRDLYVGIDPDSKYFYVKSKRLGKKVIVTATNMVNSSLGSHVLRFLKDISQIRKTDVTNGIISAHNPEYEYYPRITYGKIILKLETWIVSKDVLELGDASIKNQDLLEEHFFAYRQKAKMPKFVFLNEFDNRLLLDLDNRTHRGFIYKALQKSSVTLTELGYDITDHSLAGTEGNKHLVEIVVPFALSVDADFIVNEPDEINNLGDIATSSDVHANVMGMERKDLVLLPGDKEWLFYKIYGCSKREEELLSVIHEKLESFIEKGMMQKYFFIRYYDPESHLRLRIQATPGNISTLFSNTSDLLSTLHADGFLSKIVIDSYLRESERYGGPELIKYAEEYFSHESKFVMKLISMHRYEQSEINLEYIGVSFIIAALEVFGFSREEQMKILSSRSPREMYRKDFIHNRKMFMRAVDSSDDWFSIRSFVSNAGIYDLLNENMLALKKYVHAIKAFDNQGKLTNTVQGIASSVIHMFFIRLKGNNVWESKVHALARHGMHDFIGYQKHQKNSAQDLLLPQSLI